MDLFSQHLEPFKFNHKPIRLFESFSGIGTQAMALKRLGIEIEHVGISEIDKYAIKSYAAIHGDVKNYGNIMDIKGSDLSQIDIFTYSFPCTDLSKAGKQKGLSDTRSGLVYEVIRILKEMKIKPTVLLMENVPDLLSPKFKDGWHEIYNEIESLGYTNYVETLNAKNYGVAQNRDRVFMVSILGDYAYTFPKPFELKKRLKDYLEDNVDEKYYLSNKMLEFLNNNNQKQIERGNGFRFEPRTEEDTARSITTNAGSRMDDNFIKEPQLEQIAQIKGKGFNEMTGRVYSDKGLSPAIQTLQGGNREPKIAIPEATKQGYALAEDGDGVYINRPHQKRGVVQKGMIQTIKTSGNDVGVVDQYRIRKLTPLECWRLMGIDDKDFYKAQEVVSNSQLYKQAGNAICVDVMYYIFKNIF